MNIKIIGTRDTFFNDLLTNLEAAVADLNLECQVEIIDEIDKIIEIESKKIIITPAIIVDDKILSQGHIWSKDHITEFLKNNCRSAAQEEKQDQPGIPEKFKSWKGVPRDEIEWHPCIDELKCKGCGMCVTSCGRGVFDFDVKRNISVVARPWQCMVGCTSCKVWCVYDAISFPDEQYVKDLIKKRKILKLAKEQLEEKYPEIKE